MEDYPNLIQEQSVLPMRAQRRILEFARPRHPATEPQTIRRQALIKNINLYVKRAAIQLMDEEIDSLRGQLAMLEGDVTEISVEMNEEEDALAFTLLFGEEDNLYLEINRVSFYMIQDALGSLQGFLEDGYAVSLRADLLPDIIVNEAWTRYDFSPRRFAELGDVLKQQYSVECEERIASILRKISFIENNPLLKVEIQFRAAGLLIATLRFREGSVKVQLDSAEFQERFPNIAAALLLGSPFSTDDAADFQDGAVDEEDACVIC